VSIYWSQQNQSRCCLAEGANSDGPKKPCIRQIRFQIPQVKEQLLGVVGPIQKYWEPLVQCMQKRLNRSSQMGPWNHVLDGGPYLPWRRGNFWVLKGQKLAISKQQLPHLAPAFFPPLSILIFCSFLLFTFFSRSLYLVSFVYPLAFYQNSLNYVSRPEVVGGDRI